MPVTTNFFERPKLRPNVMVDANDSGCTIRYRDQEYDIDLLQETREGSLRFLNLLQRGEHSFEQLGVAVPDIADQIGDICRDLDRFGLLTEADCRPAVAKRGAQFYRELVRFIDRVKKKYAARPLRAALEDGTVTRNQLIGYALEYYHIVRMCPGLLAPSLSHHERRVVQSILQGFFVSELDHDKLLERSLGAVGVSMAQLDQLVPLPMTFAVCSSLGVYARQHPLSFKASLFLFEEPDGDFNSAFKQRCHSLDLPAAFYEPIFEHANINDDGDHEHISELLFSHVPSISDEEQIVVRRHICILVESLILMERQMMDYYGNDSNVVPRCFD